MYFINQILLTYAWTITFRSSISTLLWKNYAKVEDLFHPAGLSKIPNETPFALALDVDADLVECAENLSRSNPAFSRLILVHFLIVSLPTLLCGFLILINTWFSPFLQGSVRSIPFSKSYIHIEKDLLWTVYTQFQLDVYLAWRNEMSLFTIS